MLVPFWGLLVPLGLFWRRLAWLKLAPRRGEKQIFTSVRFAISIASNMDLGTSWTRFWVSHEAQELPKSVLQAMLGPPWALLGPSWGLLENLGPSWNRLGVILGPFGGRSGLSRNLSGSSRGHLVAIGGHSGASWGHLGRTPEPRPKPPPNTIVKTEMVSKIIPKWFQKQGELP